ncbi:MAG: 16S rRNA (cytosine(1402)-N(4))-methyltransferase RsmH [Prevotellaceae bacterium]|jgi:16S rRNA (cytosine1402-N4)-methyltransferase|nr:16S rRNA (cytosine(1402)-N(4))-methyltransferase RsmH [Prevotellaceae bacterium]
MATPYHIPALLHPTVDGLNIKPDGIYVDVTFGGGGHAREILNRLGADGKLFGFDQDEDAMKNAIADSRFVFVRSNFRYLRNFLKYHGVEQVDGIIADLGVSFHHFDEEERGFSFRFDSDLDMRMNKRAKLSASVVLNTYSEEDLATVFYLYGEFHNSRRIASAIVKARHIQPIKSTGELIEILKVFFNKNKEKKDLARVFQALRIEVNSEMETLKQMLMQALAVLKPGGRLSVITYHSLEDRLVKNFIRTGNFEGKQEKDFYGNLLTPFIAVNNKVIMPSDEEIAENPRSRSAKLRIAEKR